MTRSTAATPPAWRRAEGAARLALCAATLTAVAGAGLLSGCSAGQQTQTDSQVAAVPGVEGQSEDGKIAVRDVQLAYAPKYVAGDKVPVVLRVFNNSGRAVRLTAASSDRGQVVLVGGVAQAASTPAPTPAGSASGAATGSGSAAGAGSAGPSRRPAGSAVPSSAGAGSAPSASAGSGSAATTSPAPSPSAYGSTSIDVPVPVDGYAVLTPDSTAYLAISGLTGEQLRVSQSVTLTLTFTYDGGGTTAIKNLIVPVGPPQSAGARLTPSGKGSEEQ